MSTSATAKPINEKSVIALIASVQFINILDFMMVMPMGPDFARALGIPTSHLGWIGGSYTLAATVAGLIGSTFLDRFDRRKVLFFALLGLAIGTLLGGFAWGMGSLMMARMVAGLFGGPATSISLSIVSDVVPPERRGRAMGTVMGAFSLASIFGVPAGLELARLGGWRLPFFVVGGLIILITLVSIKLLPPMTQHLSHHLQGATKPFSLDFFRKPVLLAYGSIFLAMFSAFLLIPNFSAFLQNNLNYPREKLGLLYMAGGAVTLFTMRLAGKLIDRYGSAKVATVATAVLAFMMFTNLIISPPLMPPILIFVLFMVASSSRNVSVQSLSTKVPRPQERARYLSFQSAVQHASSSLGAFTSAVILSEGPGGKLIGMSQNASLSLALCIFIPVLVGLLEPQVGKGTSH